MKSRNPIIEAQSIENEFSEYINSTFEIRDPEYNRLFKDELAKMQDSLYKGPYLCSFLPFEPDKTIPKLINEGVMHPNFLKLGGIKKEENRRLYWHQVEAIRRIESGRSAVITTGTGSGKTECFLYPILDSIIKEIASGGENESGIRAIFLFPMNALINDQIDRIRELLENYPEIKFGFFTGETPESNEKDAVKKFFDMYGKSISSNELITREQMRDNPPHILFTNYSMLEYLLIRPQDSKLISADSMKHWNFFVLDEAHTYRGALGIEISILLRRLMGIAGRTPRFILTSATLGRGRQDIQKILSFAHSLTSTEFVEDDVIFAKRRKLNRELNTYSIDPDDYIEILENFDCKEKIIPTFEKYLNFDDSSSIEENLFYLLEKDKNTTFLYDITKNGHDFFDVRHEMLFSKDDQLVSLIELIAKAKSKEGLKLFDTKYHMFIKAPDGAFITLGEEKHLSLLTCRTIGPNKQKAFKIGICQNCNTPYIMGRIEDDILCIDDEVDIDEEYSEKIKKLGYYLIGSSLTQIEIDDIEQNHKDEFEKYYVCPQCGHIRRANSAKTSKCECGVEEAVLYKYSEHDDEQEINVFSNNIKKCPICDFQTKNGGVVLGFHIGKDRATALLAQILYRAMDYPQVVDESKPIGMFRKEVAYKNGPKQFIAFSDARQQAAFFNKFLDSNDLRFLKKSLIWKILKEDGHHPIRFPRLVEKLEAEFKEPIIGYSPDEAHKQALAGALYDLLLVDGRNSAEGLGLFAFKLDLPGEYQNDDQIETYLKTNGFDISAEQFRILTLEALEVFRTVPAIEYPVLTTNYDELDDLLGYRKFNNYIAEKLPENTKEKNIRSFLPIKDSFDNKTIKFIKKALKCDSPTAKKLLEIIFRTASDTGLLEQKGTNKYQIKANSYSVHSYLEEGIKFYYCDKCKKLTIYNYDGICPESDCDGKLIECNPDSLLEKNYYRKEYMTRPNERMYCREHTAQIKSEEAKRIQQDFKNGKINIISCSTTFEMGIDLGGLTTVFMRNIPPTPANYIQRAGRAGRRSNTSAFVLTFCGMSSHDYTFFNDPEPMIEGIVEPPYFTIENDKIIIRHITASALSFYFKQNPGSFENVDIFLNEDHIQKFFDYVNSKPTNLGDYIDKFVLMTDDLLNVYGDFKWINYLEADSSSKGALNNLKDGINDSISTYETAITKLREEEPFGYGKLIDQYREAIRKLKFKNSLIQYFARYGVIPRYGFPIDNASLQIYDTKKSDFDDKYDLTRNLSIAISEYAPGSEVIVDGRKYTSRYIFTPYPNAPQNKSYYVQCPHCEAMNLFLTKDISSDTKCKYCGDSLNANQMTIKEFIRPTRGFVADQKNEETRRIKPARSYSSDVMYVGDGKNPSIEPINICDVIVVTEFKNEELLVLNENPFFYCEKCGYTELNRKTQATFITHKHKDHKGYDCTGDGKLYLTHLGHTYNTDVVKLQVSGISQLMDYESAVSTLYAILEGISSCFNIERNDIGGMVFNPSPGIKPYEFILFDTVAGGAGHVKRLESETNVISVLHWAYKKVNQNCCQEETSCYSCLRNFGNQRLHKHLKRGKAKETILAIIDAIATNRVSMKIENIALELENSDLMDFANNGTLEGFDKECFIDIVNHMNGEIVDKPSGYGITIKGGDGSTFHADFFWKDKGILLFSLDNLDSYHSLGNHQSRFDCYIMDENFNVVQFVERLRK